MKKKITLFLLFVFTAGIAVNAQEAIQIGTSNLPTATAYNNARRMVRTSDDRLVVVYQDQINNTQKVMWIYSDDTQHWSTPKFLAYGREPAIAIKANDDIVVAWVSLLRSEVELSYLFKSALNSEPQFSDVTKISDFFPDARMQKSHFPMTANHYECPSLATTGEGVHLVVKNYGEIHYYSFCENFLGDRTLNINRSAPDDGYPTISGELEYEDGLAIIAWTEQKENDDQPYLMLFSFSTLRSSSFDELFEFYSPGEGLLNMKNPSLSVRTPYRKYDDFEYGDHESILVCDYKEGARNYLAITAYAKSRDSDDTSWNSKYAVNSITYPTADDLAPYPRTCAILWQNSNQIYYGQTDDAYLDSDPTQISNSVNEACWYPSVCYKTWRSSYFDVVWTQGDKVPYKIMYRRMLKKLPGMALLPDQLPRGTYLHAYVQPIGIGTKHFDWAMISGALPDGITFTFNWESGCRITGVPKESGLFEFAIEATCHFSNDVAPKDTVVYHLIIANSRPIITSSSVVTRNNEGNISYRIKATDPEGNIIRCVFENYPAWMEISGSAILGTPPINAPDTSFIAIATDGEMADTLKVVVDLNHPTAINTTSAGIPTEFRLWQNYPNPFNLQTTITCALPACGIIKVKIYDLTGRLIRVFEARKEQPGNYAIQWDGSDNDDNPVSSGIYICVGKFVDFSGKMTQYCRKMSLIK